MNPILIALTSTLALGTASAIPVFVNEFHYDNAGADTGEFLEIAGPAGTDLTGWSIVLYNGSSTLRAPYNTLSLSGTIDDEGAGFGALAFPLPANGLQNGSPDGFALVDPTATVLQFLSYEGSFVALSGPAATLTSVDIGVAESSATPAGSSLQLIGNGSDSSSFAWSGPTTSSPGSLNAGQTFAGPSVPESGSTSILLLGSLLALRMSKRKRG